MGSRAKAKTQGEGNIFLHELSETFGSQGQASHPHFESVGIL